MFNDIFIIVKYLKWVHLVALFLKEIYVILKLASQGWNLTNYFAHQTVLSMQMLLNFVDYL